MIFSLKIIEKITRLKICDIRRKFHRLDFKEILAFGNNILTIEKERVYNIKAFAKKALR